MTEAHVLAATLDRTRDLTRFYMGKLKGLDMHRRFTVNGVELNSAYWIVAHLTSSENWLVLRGTGGPFQKYSWAKLFNLGSQAPDPSACPPLEEILAAFKEVHANSIAHVAGLSEEQLSAPHQALMKIGGQDQVRDVILHAIRHEGLHCGHLSWLCKLHGVPTV